MSEPDSIPIRLKEIRERGGVGVREMARRCGMSPSSYRHYESPDRFKATFLPLRQARIFASALSEEGLSEEVMALAGVDHPSMDKPVRVESNEEWPEPGGLVPVYDVQASAGFGAAVHGEEHIYNLAFDPSFLRQMTNAKPRELAIIQVQGDSMEPTLLNGDQVLVDRSKNNLDFDGLFVIRYGEALHIKRVGRAPKRGHVLIRSDNERYTPLEVPYGEIDVVGRVLWYGRKV